MTRGHSNLKLEAITTNPNTGAAMIGIEGGATVNTVRPLPTLALRKNEWREIGDRMQWWTSTDSSGGTLWIEFHDRGGRVAVEELSRNGIHDAMFQCTQMLEELEQAKENLDSIESDEDGDE